MQADGSVVPNDVSMGYIDIKSGVQYTIYSGYKLWASTDDITVDLEVDGEPFKLIWDNAVTLTASAITAAATLLLTF